jgi:hypothetical protein
MPISVIAKDVKKQVLDRELQKMKSHAEPIRLDLDDEALSTPYTTANQVLLRKLRYYPFIQLFVIIVFIVAAYSAFIATQRAEQNQVWVGMSKETAHQLGTPISSLMAWIELLKASEYRSGVNKRIRKGHATSRENYRTVLQNWFKT